MKMANRRHGAIAVGVGVCLVAMFAASGVATAQTRKIIVDCDPGIDDAVALVLALQYPGFEILGITTTFGNATIDHTTRNALRVVELSGRSIPVYRGAGNPRIVPPRPPPDLVRGPGGV
jgi:inosine-uridine nucleoside N-ribohydrolase